MSITQLAKNIKLIIFDVDGVLTDGGLYVTPEGQHILRFHIQDGCGIKQLQKIDVIIAIISGRKSQALELRLQELNIQHVYLGQDDKLLAYDMLLSQLQLTHTQVAYVGDDTPDLCVMKKVALPIAVANAVDSVKTAAKYCTKRTGGNGAVREVCDLIYTAQCG